MRIIFSYLLFLVFNLASINSYPYGGIDSSKFVDLDNRYLICSNLYPRGGIDSKNIINLRDLYLISFNLHPQREIVSNKFIDLKKYSQGVVSPFRII